MCFNLTNIEIRSETTENSKNSTTADKVELESLMVGDASKVVCKTMTSR